MRPVNLIPGELRRGMGPGRRKTSTGYIVIGAMAAVLIGMLVLVMTNNQITDRKSQVARLKVEERQAQARAEKLAAFTAFRSTEEARSATVASLAQSRFDWERVMRELSLVLPDNVWLVNLTGSASPGIELDGGASISSRDGIAGPALEIVGCTTTQDDVAEFVSALEDIDGVTRVGVDSSERPETSGDSGGSGGSDDDCRTRDFIYQFEIVVAFDEVPAPEGATAAPSLPAAGPTATEQTAAATQAADSVSGAGG